MIDLLRHLDPRRLGIRTHALGGTLVVIGGTMLAGGAVFSGPVGALVPDGITVASAANNNGDFWVDNVGSSKNSEDPQLDCADIDLWGSDIAVATGTYEIDLQDPSGTGEAYSASWSYDSTATDPQVLAVIPVTALMADAANLNATGKVHFKISLPIYPSKHKTFWIDCSSTSSTTSTSTSTSTDTTTTSTSTSTSTQDTDTSSTDSSSTTSDSSSNSSDSSSSDSSSSSSSTDSSSSDSTSSDSSSSSTTTDPSTTSTSSSSSTSSVDATSQTQSQSSSSSSSSSNSNVGGTGAGNPPATGSGTTTTSSPSSPAPTTSTGTTGADPVSNAPGVPEIALSVPEAGADVPFVPGFLLILAGAGLLACRPRRRKA